MLPAIKNKQKREQEFLKAKKEKRQAKLQRRLATAKREADDPKAKQVRAFSLPFRLSQTRTHRRNDWQRMSRARSKTHANSTRLF
jgi:hypothetical protein